MPNLYHILDIAVPSGDSSLPPSSPFPRCPDFLNGTRHRPLTLARVMATFSRCRSDSTGPSWPLALHRTELTMTHALSRPCSGGGWQRAQEGLGVERGEGSHCAKLQGESE